MFFVLLVLLAGGGAGAWFVHKGNVYKASPEYALEQLHQALVDKDADLLTAIIDLDTFSQSVVTAAQALPPDSLVLSPGAPGETPGKTSVEIGEAPAALTSKAVTEVILALVQEEDLSDIGFFKLMELPETLHEQLTQKPFILTTRTSDSALAEIHIHYLDRKDSLTLQVLLAQADGIWRIAELANADDLVAKYRDAVEMEKQRLKEMEAEALARDMLNMERLMPNMTCTAALTVISSNIPILILSVNSDVNPGPEVIEHWGAILTITNSAGEIVLAPQVRLNQNLYPGQTIDKTWQQELEQPEYSRLQAMEPFTCSAQREFAFLNDGKLLRSSL